MIIDDICIQIRASATGVKTGIDAAERELERFEALKANLNGELELKINGLEDAGKGIEDLTDKIGQIEAVSAENAFMQMALTAESAFSAIGAAVREGSDAYAGYEAQVLSTAEAVLEENQSFSTLTGTLGDMKQSLGMLTGAYETLSQSKELGINQIGELIYLYPELARHLSETGDATFQEGQIVQAVWESEKEVFLNKIKAQKEVTDATVAEATVRINQYKAELAAMNAFFGALRSVNPRIDGLMGNKESALAEQQAYLKDLTDTQKQLESAMMAIDSLALGGGSGKSAKRSSGGGSKASGLQKENEAVKAALEEYKLLIRLDHFSNTEEQARYLEELYQLNKAAFDKDLKLFAEYYDASKSITQKGIDSLKDMRQGALAEEDYTAIIDAGELLLDGLKSSAAEYQKIKGIIQETQQDLSDYYADMEKNALDAFQKDETRRISLLKSYNGLKYGADEQDVYQFDITDEIRSYEKRLQAYHQYIESLVSGGEELSKHQQKLLADAEAEEIKLMDKIEDLYIQHLHQRQKDYEQLVKEEEKLLKQQTTTVDTEMKNQAAAIKAKYALQIEEAKAAAAAEIKILQDQIKEIDRMLYQREIDDKDAIYNRKKNQLEQTILYERDDSNRYELQKELDNLTAEYEKRKAKEALEAQKKSLNDQIDVIKQHENDTISQLQKSRDKELAALEGSTRIKIQLYQEESNAKLNELEKQVQAATAFTETELASIETMIQEKLEIYEDSGLEISRIFQKETENRMDENMTQLKGLSSFYSEKYKKAYNNAREEKELFSATVNDIIRFLLNKIPEFSDAGWKAGSAYASAFNSAVSSISAKAANVLFSGATTPMAQDVQLSFTQNITSPVATPASVARQTKSALEDMLRYI